MAQAWVEHGTRARSPARADVRRGLAQTGSYARQFGETWPQVAPQLRFVLRLRGVDADSIDDIVQETALRALARLVPFSSAEDLYRWARVVAVNLSIADYRRTARVAFEPPPEHHPAEDVVAIVESRLRLEDVWRQIAELPDRELQAVLFEICGRPEWAEQNWGQWKAALTRVRAKLREGVTTVVGLLREWSWRTCELSTTAALLGGVAIPVLVLTVVPTYRLDGESEHTRLPVPRPPAATPATTATPNDTSPDSPGTRGSHREHATAAPAAPRVDAAPDSGSGSRKPLVEAPRVEDSPRGTVTRNDDDYDNDIRFCTENFPVLGTGCVVRTDPSKLLPTGVPDAEP